MLGAASGAKSIINKQIVGTDTKTGAGGTWPHPAASPLGLHLPATAPWEHGVPRAGARSLLGSCAWRWLVCPTVLAPGTTARICGDVRSYFPPPGLCPGRAPACWSCPGLCHLSSMLKGPTRLRVAPWGPGCPSSVLSSANALITSYSLFNKYLLSVGVPCQAPGTEM